MKTWTIYLIWNYGGEIMILQSSILIQHSNQHGIVRLSTWNSNLQEEGYWPTCWSCLMTAVPIKVSIMIESMPWSSKLNLKSTRSINLNSRLEVYCWPELRRLGFKHDSIWQHSLSLNLPWNSSQTELFAGWAKRAGTGKCLFFFFFQRWFWGFGSSANA